MLDLVSLRAGLLGFVSVFMGRRDFGALFFWFFLPFLIFFAFLFLKGFLPFIFIDYVSWMVLYFLHGLFDRFPGPQDFLQ